MEGEIGEGNCVFQLCNCVNGGLLIREEICSLDGTPVMVACDSGCLKDTMYHIEI